MPASVSQAPAFLCACALAAGMLAARPAAAAPAGGAPAGAAAGAAADSIATGGEEALRGTTAPLTRRIAPWRWAARGLLAVPYGAIELVSLPVEGGAYLNERYRPLSRVARLLTLEFGNYSTRVGPLFGYATSLGLSPVGASLKNDDWLGTGTRLRAAGGYLDDRENVATLRLSRAVGEWSVRLRAEQRSVGEIPFYGPGAASPDRELTVDREQSLVELGVARRIAPGVTAAVTAYFRDQENVDPDGDDTPVRDVFPELAAAAEDARYVGIDAELTLDGRNAGSFSSAGSLLRVSGGLDRARSDGDGDYRHGAVEAQQFLNLWRNVRVLALRGEVRFLDADDGVMIPFSEWESLGGSAGPRGYPAYRFADRAAAVVTAEYRYRVTQRFEGRLLADWGTVAPRAGDLRLSDSDPTFGFALVVPSPEFPFAAEISFSPEGHELRVGFGSLWDGRSRREIQ